MDFLENGNVTNSVNFPQTRLDRGQGYRITFTNRNVPKVLGSVLGCWPNATSTLPTW